MDLNVAVVEVVKLKFVIRRANVIDLLGHFIGSPKSQASMHVSLEKDEQKAMMSVRRVCKTRIAACRSCSGRETGIFHTDLGSS